MTKTKTRFLQASCATSLLLAGCAFDDPQEDEHVAQAESPLFVASNRVWTNPDIPVCWETPGSTVEKGWVRDAIRKTWEAEANVEFTGWGQCNASTNSGIRIRIADVGPATLGLGTQLDNLPNGMQLNFQFQVEFQSCQADREGCIRSIAVHEFGHALGFAHEQNRGDTPATCTAGAQGSNGDTTVGAWDLMSVMNYCNPRWNNNGMLSGSDIQGVHQFYGTRNPIAVSARSPVQIDAFVHRLDHNIGANFLGLPWEHLGGQITGAPAAISMAPGIFQLFVRGMDGALWTKSWTGASYTGFTQLQSNAFFGSPTAVRMGSQIAVVVRGTDNALYVKRGLGASFGGYVGLGGSIVGTPSAVGMPDGSLEVFARGTDGTLWNASMTAGGATSIRQLGTNPFAGDPAAVVTRADQISVLVRGTDDALYIKRRTAGVWESGYTQLAPNAIRGNPAAASWGPNRLDVFVRGTNNALYAKSFDGAVWTDYVYLGGQIMASPSVIAPAVNRLEVFVRGTNSSMYKMQWNGSSWSGFAHQGQSFM